MRRIVSEKEIEQALILPPETTRAFFRGRAVAKFGSAISALQWDEIVFAEGKRTRRVALPEPLEDARLLQLNALVTEATDFEEFFRALHRPEFS